VVSGLMRALGSERRRLGLKQSEMVPGSCDDVRRFGGVGGAVDLKPEFGNPVRGATDVTPCGRWDLDWSAICNVA
jgi:hypothetical protein